MLQSVRRALFRRDLYHSTIPETGVRVGLRCTETVQTVLEY